MRRVHGGGGEPIMTISRFSPLLVILMIDGALKILDWREATAKDKECYKTTEVGLRVFLWVRRAK